MAQFYPPITDILRFSVKPTEGEFAMLRFIEKNLDNSYEIYFNPYLNGDRPDIIILRKGHGALIIEVKDWNLDNFSVEEKKRWHYKDPQTGQDSVVKSPLDQVYKYKENLFDLHIDNLLNLKIQDIRNFNMVGCALYFHKATIEEVKATMIDPFKEDKKYQKFLQYNIGLLGNDSLNAADFDSMLSKFYLNSSWNSKLFTDEIYANFKRVLTPTLHMINDGHPISYDKRQMEVITRPVQMMRVKGVFGSGKTTVLAARAVHVYKRLCQSKERPKILILTFNLTLKNFIHDKIMQVPQEFTIQDFVIINYHQFINAELNNMGIDIKIPKEISPSDIPAYLERNYYSNEKLFNDHKDKIKPYDAILIDEIQDYKRSWMNIVKDSFLAQDGEYMIFGDVKQNIYGNPTENKDVITNIPARPTYLKHCYRSDSKIRDLALEFQKVRFGDKYELDDFNAENDGGLFANVEKPGFINYIHLSNTQIVSTLYTIIRENILNKVNNVAPNDITVLGYTTPLLREFDHYYRLLSHEKTKTMFEVPEIMYLSRLNYLKPYEEAWYKSLFNQLWKCSFPQNEKLEDWQTIRLRKHIALLLATSELYNKYPDRLQVVLTKQCNDLKINFKAFLDYLEHYKSDIEIIRNNVLSADYELIRKNKKINFWMNCGMLKISTIHSFKGWESRAVFLIVENEAAQTEFDELLYTGITRAKENLIVINFGNENYHKIFKLIFDKVNKTI
ncbi:NERD domain-containing protein [uncultured Bacteroides sp.]|uniref:NERD domain-containing protein n=1 Tax=uncultured Bacteroides sp. TaxID=162156 RepID=UPI00266577C4|nr:NERD domain-containing protein [uncultured Bacteroides sp.]